MNTIRNFFIAAFLLVTGAVQVFSQAQQDNKAVELLQKSLGFIWEQGDYALYFEGIAYSIDDPKKIFSLPVYKVNRGGFVIVKDNKYEMRLGLMKAVSDGKLMVSVDEQSKMIVIDSVRKSSSTDSLVIDNDLAGFVDESLLDVTLSYEGTEKVNNVSCHKVKALYSKEENLFVYYWIEESTNRLLLMGEHQNNYYDAYWFRKIERAPKNHVFTLNIPVKRLETLHGYDVSDFRYAR